MRYRVLCDENVPESTVQHLERDDVPAMHVTADLGAGSSDDDVAAHALKENSLLLTNDADFLDGSTYSDVRVLYYPDNSVSGHVLARRVRELVALVPDPADLGRITFLTG